MNKAYIRQSSWILYFLSAAGRTFQHGSSSVTLNFCGFCAEPSTEPARVTSDGAVDARADAVLSGAVGGRAVDVGRRGDESAAGVGLDEDGALTGWDVADGGALEDDAWRPTSVAMLGLTGTPVRPGVTDVAVAGWGIGSVAALVGVFGLTASLEPSADGGRRIWPPRGLLAGSPCWCSWAPKLASPSCIARPEVSSSALDASVGERPFEALRAYEAHRKLGCFLSQPGRGPPPPAVADGWSYKGVSRLSDCDEDVVAFGVPPVMGGGKVMDPPVSDMMTSSR
jgi:hypothetical protein